MGVRNVRKLPIQSIQEYRWVRHNAAYDRHVIEVGARQFDVPAQGTTRKTKVQSLKESWLGAERRRRLE